MVLGMVHLRLLLLTRPDVHRLSAPSAERAGPPMPKPEFGSMNSATLAEQSRTLTPLFGDSA